MEAPPKSNGERDILHKLAVVLENGSYRPLAARRVLIPKPGSTEQRPLSIPTEAA